jgi:D-arabinose 1-dehydrogenase-like Zn-dependent alcohol dehydrogenase
LFVRSAECAHAAGRDARRHLTGILGVTLNGGFAEFFQAPQRNLLVLPDEVSFDIGGLASCAVITAVHAFRLSGLQSGDTAAVMGAGGIGQILVQLLRHADVRTWPSAARGACGWRSM